MRLLTLVEDRTQGYLHLLKGSKAPVPDYYELGDVQYSYPVGTTPKTIGDLRDEIHLQIIEAVKSIVDPEFKKYEEYFIQQIAKGNLPLNKIEEDGERFNIMFRLFQKLSRKALWTGSKNIFGYDNWRTLESVTRKLAKEANVSETDTGDSDQNSVVLFKKTYKDNKAELLSSIYGDPELAASAPSKTYYLRKILTPEGACKYGRGTTWCTNTKVPPKEISLQELIKVAEWRRNKTDDEPELFEMSRGDILYRALPALGIYDLLLPGGRLNEKSDREYNKQLVIDVANIINGKSDTMINPEYLHNTAMQYIRRGLYIIELEDAKPRRPIMQMSEDQIMQVQDIPVTKAGHMLADFIRSAMKALQNEDLGGFENILPSK